MSHLLDGPDLFQYAESSCIAFHPFKNDVTVLLSPIAGCCQPPGNTDVIDERYEEHFETSRKDMNSFKLSLSIESACLLAAAQNASKAEAPPLDWDAMLPRVHSFPVFKSKIPLLTEQEERRFRASFPPENVKVDILQLSEAHRSLGPLADIDPPTTITELSEQCKRKLGLDKFKLSITKESLGLISRARNVSAVSARRVGALFDELLEVPKLNTAHLDEMIIHTERGEAQSTLASGFSSSPSLPDEKPATNHCLSAGLGLDPILSGHSQLSSSPRSLIAPEIQEDNGRTFTTTGSRISNSKASRTHFGNFPTDESRSAPQLESFTEARVQELTRNAQVVLNIDAPFTSTNDPSSRPFRTKSTPASPNCFLSKNLSSGQRSLEDYVYSTEICTSGSPPRTEGQSRGILNKQVETQVRSGGHRKETRSLKEPNNDIKGQDCLPKEHVDPIVSTPRPFSGALGSLSTFMETRGVCVSNSDSNDPYCPRGGCDIEEREGLIPNPTRVAHNITIEDSLINPSFFIKVPTIERHSEVDVKNLVIFFSTDLLKTHLRTIQSLEHLENSPRYIYRDYSHFQSPQHLNDPSSPPQIPADPPQETDCIIAPSVGVMLTTSQAISQSYLPGHKATDPVIRNQPSITSPIRERIFRLAPRYEVIYLLISHPCSKSVAEDESTNLFFQMDKFTRESYDSIQEFCSSVFPSTKMLPLLIPATPGATAEWILVLAARHSACLLTTDHLSRMPHSNIAALDKVPRKITMSNLIKEDETQYEVYLRGFGLNPYAARVILDTLEAEATMGNEQTEFSNSNSDSSISGLMQFIEMGQLERSERFGMLLGERLLSRFDEAFKCALDREDEVIPS